MNIRNRKWTEWILGCIYPRRCPICDRVIAVNDARVCKKCESKYKLTEGFHCMKCGKFLRLEEEEFCEDCRRREHFFDEGFGVFPYHGWPQDTMIRFKFQKRQEYAGFFAESMILAGQERIKRWKPEVIVPVPMHRRKKKRRGYDQAELLANLIGTYYKIPVRTDLVIRIQNTKPQKELDPKTRRKNLRQAFLVTEEIKKYQRILLIDDIYTTGSTVDAIAERMKQQGAKKIYVLTACTGIGT